MRILGICVVWLFLGNNAIAGPDRISLLLGSKHINSSERFNEVNPGLIFTWEESDIDFSIGAYENSYRKLSIVGTVGYNLVRTRDFSAGVFLGLARYPGNGSKFALNFGNDVIPLAGLQMRYRSIFLQVLPGDGQVNSAVVTFGATFSLKPE